MPSWCGRHRIKETENIPGLSLRYLDQNQLQLKARIRASCTFKEPTKLPPVNQRMAIANAQLIARGKWDITEERSLRILPATLELMRTFRGKLGIKNHDTINNFRLHPIFNCQAESSKQTLFLSQMLHYELMLDDSIIQCYTSYCLSLSGLTATLRAILFDWMIKLQQYLGFSSEALHFATTLVDRYIWRKLTSPNQYQLVGIAAVILGVKFTTRKLTLRLEELCYLTENAYSREELLLEEEELLKAFNYIIHCPIPHTFVGFGFVGLKDLPKGVNEYSLILICRYMFDLGLMEFTLTQYPASLKCAAAIYFIRRLVRIACQNSSDDLAVCASHHVASWTEVLAAMTGHMESAILKGIAFIYGLLLIEAQFMLNETEPGLMAGCGSSFRAAFKKYSHENSQCVAKHELVKIFTISDIVDLDLN